MLVNETKMKALFDRVYNGKSIESEEVSDSADLNAYIVDVFGKDGKTPDKVKLQQFNQLVIEKADKEAEPIIKDLIGLFADIDFTQRGNIIKYELPTNKKAKFIWSAVGSEVDLVRVDGQKSHIAIPRTFETGFVYQPDELVRGGEQKFNELIDAVKDYRIDLYLEQMMRIIEKAVRTQTIPEVNKIEGAETTVKDFNKLVGTIARFGGQPLFIADPLLIEHYAMQQPTTEGLSSLITEEYKGELLHSLNISKIGRALAVGLDNPFIDEDNTLTELPVDTGFMLAGEGRRKPFKIVDYGAMRFDDDYDFRTGEVKVRVALDASIDLVYANSLGYIKDTGVTLG